MSSCCAVNIETINHILICAIILLAVIIDWRTTKIPNLLTFPAAVVGIVLNFLNAGWMAALHAVAGWLLGAVLIVLLSVAPLGPKRAGTKIGMGDAKLIAAIGAFLGPKAVLLVVFYFCLCYGLLSLASLALVVPWKQVAENVQLFLIASDKPRPALDTSKLTAKGKGLMPISLAILAATLITIAFQKQSLAFFGL